MSTNSNRPKRRLWPWLVGGGALVLVAAIILGVIYGARGSGTPDPTPTGNASTPAPTGTGVDACLGGPDLTAEQLFTAQRDAPHTPEGAVSYAASFVRYVLRLPLPADLDEAASWNSDLSADWWSSYEASMQSWTGPNPFSVTTVNGSYSVQSYTPESAVVTLSLPMVIDGAITSRTFVPTVTLGQTVAGNWTVTGVDNSAAEDSSKLTNSTDFTGGC